MKKIMFLALTLLTSNSVFAEESSSAAINDGKAVATGAAAYFYEFGSDVVIYCFVGKCTEVKIKK